MFHYFESRICCAALTAQPASNTVSCPGLHSSEMMFFQRFSFKGQSLHVLKLMCYSTDTTEIPTAAYTYYIYTLDLIYNEANNTTLFTFFSHPTFHAGFVSILITCVVTNKIISRATKFIAQSTVVIFITLHSYLYFKMGNRTIKL